MRFRRIGGLPTGVTVAAPEVVELEQKLANERIFRDKLQNNLTGLLRSMINNMDGSTLAVGNAEFEAVQKLTKEARFT